MAKDDSNIYTLMLRMKAAYENTTARGALQIDRCDTPLRDKNNIARVK